MVSVSDITALSPATLPSSSSRKVFVAYPYALPKDDYRRPFSEVGAAFNVQFTFADEKISDLHILDKIKDHILDSAFGIYDISGWNSNVALELGLALGIPRRAFIAFDPSKTPLKEVPSDLRGMDRLQYGSYSELGTQLERLIAQELPLPRTHDAENQLDILRETILGLVTVDDGLKVGDIAKALGISTELAKVVVRPLVEQGQLRIVGATRAAKYLLAT